MELVFTHPGLQCFTNFVDFEVMNLGTIALGKRNCRLIRKYESIGYCALPQPQGTSVNVFPQRCEEMIAGQ